MAGIDTVSLSTHLPQKIEPPAIFAHELVASTTAATTTPSATSAYSTSLPRSSSAHSSRSSSVSPPSPHTSPRPSPSPSPSLLSKTKHQEPLQSHSKHSSISELELQQTLQQSISIQRKQQDIIASLHSARSHTSGSSSANSERSSPTLGSGPNQTTLEDVVDLADDPHDAKLISTNSQPKSIPLLDQSCSPGSSKDSTSSLRGSTPTQSRNAAAEVSGMIRNDGDQSTVIRQQVIDTGPLPNPEPLSSDAPEEPESSSLSSSSLDYAAAYIGPGSISRMHSPQNLEACKRLRLPEDDDASQYLSAKRLSRSHVPLPLRLSRLPSYPPTINTNTTRSQPWLAPIQPHRARSIPMYRPHSRFAPSPSTPNTIKQLCPQYWRHFQLLQQQQQQQLHRLQRHYQMAATSQTVGPTPNLASGVAMGLGTSMSPNVVTDVYLGHVSRPAPLLAQPLSAQREAFIEHDSQEGSSLIQASEFGKQPLRTQRPIFGQISLMNEAIYKFKIRPGGSKKNPQSSTTTKASTDDDSSSSNTNERAEWLAREREKFLKVCGDTWDLHFTNF